MKVLAIFTIFMFAITIPSVSSFAQAKQSGKKKKVKYRKLQKVDFDGSAVDGQARNPNGSYLVQKRGINFVPLYNVKDNFDSSIIESMEYVE